MTYVIPHEDYIPAISNIKKTTKATDFLEISRRARDRLIVPTLWWYEVVSGLRRAEALGILTRTVAHQALEQIDFLRVEAIPPSKERNRSVLHWAEKTGQTKAYDAHYLVLAEEIHAEFWTADQRLVNAVHKTGAAWIHWIGE